MSDQSDATEEKRYEDEKLKESGQMELNKNGKNIHLLSI